MRSERNASPLFITTNQSARGPLISFLSRNLSKPDRRANISPAAQQNAMDVKKLPTWPAQARNNKVKSIDPTNPSSSSPCSPYFKIHYVVCTTTAKEWESRYGQSW